MLVQIYSYRRVYEKIWYSSTHISYALSHSHHPPGSGAPRNLASYVIVYRYSISSQVNIIVLEIELELRNVVTFVLAH
jgi:hypothetical protein